MNIEAFEAFKADVENYPDHTRLDRQWKLARRYNVGMTQISYFHKILASEGMLYYIQGANGGYFTIKASAAVRTFRSARQAA